jgi:uncharacterized membrane protein YczE
LADKEELMIKIIKKLMLYIGGLLILATGTNFSKAAQLGISPVSATPYALELIWGIELGKSTTLIFIVLVLLQIILLRKNYKPVQLLQIGCTYLFGFFISFTGSTLLTFLPTPSTYFMKLTYLFISIICAGTGVFLYLIPNYISLPPEGVVNAIMELGKGKFKFANVKIAVDGTLVITSAILSLVFLGGLETVREGTVLSALLTGKVVGFMSKNFKNIILEWIEGSDVSETFISVGQDND